MSSRIYVMAVLFVMCGGIPIFAGDPQLETNLPAPPGHFLIHEELWTDLADEPGLHMDRAREAFLAMDLGEAAAALRKAATYLKISANQAAESSKHALLRVGA